MVSDHWSPTVSRNRQTRFISISFLIKTMRALKEPLFYKYLKITKLLFLKGYVLSHSPFIHEIGSLKIR